MAIVALAAVVFFVILLIVKGPKYFRQGAPDPECACLIACVFSIPFVTKAAINSDILSGYFGNLAQGYEEVWFCIQLCFQRGGYRHAAAGGLFGGNH